jgi:site-specific DNA recombinase
LSVVLIPYLRKSSGEDPVVSRDRQTRAIAAWSAAHPEVTLAPEIWEGRVSGSKNWKERGLGEALRMIEDGLASGVIVEEQSRLSRENGLATAEVWDAFQSANVRLVCTAEGLDTATGDHELSFAMRAALAREQWKQYARRMDHVKAKKVVDEGIHICGTLPVGYVRDPETKVLVRSEHAPLVERAFTMRARGCSIGQIVSYLDDEFPAGRWSTTRVSRMLKGRVYLGEARSGEKYVKPNAHPALVDQETFDIVQSLFAKSDAPATVKHLLSTVIRCESCGYAMSRSRVNGRYFVYRCKGSTGPGKCSSPVSIPAPAVEDHVWNLTVAELRKEFERGDIASSAETDTISRIHARLVPKRETLALFQDPAYAQSIGREAAIRGASEVADQIRVLEAELAEAVRATHVDSRPDIAEIIERIERGEISDDDRRVLISGTFGSIMVGRAPRLTPISERVTAFLVGDANAPARPARGRPRYDAEQESGVLAA